MPSLNSFETDMRKLRRKRRAKRAFKNVSFILAVIIVAGLIYLSRDSWIKYFDGILDRAKNNVAVQNDGALAGGNYPIDISKKTNTGIGTLGKNWTLFADTTFYVYDPSGEIIYSEQAPYSNPIVEYSDKRTLIYDQGGYSFSVNGPRDQIYSKRLTDQILLGAIGPDGSVAIVTATDKFAAYLTIYDKNGSEIYHWADGTLITAIAINSNGTGCLLSSSYARAGSYRSVVTQLSFSSDEVVMQSKPIETLTFALSYAQNGFWLVGRDAAYLMNEDGTVAQSYSYDYELINYSLSDRLVALAFEGIGERGGRVAVLSSDAGEVYETWEDLAVNDVYTDGSAVYLCFGSRIDAIDKSGNLLATAPVDAVYRKIAVLEDEIYLLGYRAVDKIEFGF